MREIEGVVEDVVFRNEQNGYTVLTLREGRERVTCVGVLPGLAAGERLRVQGEWSEHRDYGRQLKVSGFESVRPSTLKDIERYLGSGIIKGIGPTTAKQIVSAFGEQALVVLDDAPERLTEISGIGPKRARMITQSYQQQREARQAMVFLQGCGLSPAMCTRVIKAFGDQAQRAVRSDPYQLVEKVEGVGFKTADAIAFSLGMGPHSEHRMTCGVKYLLQEATHSGGHVFLPRDKLLDRAEALLGAPRAECERALNVLSLDGSLVQREADGVRVVYQRGLYEAEREVAARLVALMRAAVPAKDPGLGKKIARYEKDENISLNQGQREAVIWALTRQVVVLTGGPGTGKTTCIRCILRLLKGAGEVLLCAPTGRAARRMQEASGEAAQTIHRLLEYSGESGGFQRNEDAPLEAGALIVDETSMVDLLLMRSLLRALPGGTRLVLVGDADQLPSVGAGNVLGDLIESGVVPVARLIEIYRQAAQSDIVTGAHRINHGEMPLVNRKGGDFFFERALTAGQAALTVRELVRSRLPKYLSADPMRAIQVMSPMKKGESGVWALGRMLQEALNPPDSGKRELYSGDGVLREGDKVMQVRNNYELEWTRGQESGMGVFNGDIGYIASIDNEEGDVTVCFDDERVAVYGGEDLIDLEIAYCVSVHKSQGSEFEAVVLPLVSGPPMLFTRNLLYTAVTRAKRLVVLVGREDCVKRMVDNSYVSVRYSNLAGALREVSGA